MKKLSNFESFPFASGEQSQSKDLRTRLRTTRIWIMEGLLAAAFSGAIYFLS